MESVWEVVNRNFPSFVAGIPLSVLCFSTSWAPSDKYMYRRLIQLTHNYPMIRVGYMDVDLEVNFAIVKIIGINRVPTVAYFVRGCKKDVLEGPQSLLTLSNAVKRNLNEAERIHRLWQRRNSV
jgi:thioredoxin-like negative regulator of GroEL